ncbi:MAG: glycosyltransferase family 2 protein [Woeseiaceae bacterium]
MKLSIITVNYRSWHHLQNALDALAQRFPDDWEMIIVDNESEPESFRAFQERNPWVRMIANPVNSGFGIGCMVGVAEASGTQLLFMNPDVIATPEQIQALLRVKHENPDIKLLSPRQLGNDGQPQKVFDEFPDLLNQSKLLKALRRRLFPARSPDPRAEHKQLVWCDWITGSFLLIDRHDFDAIGGWSADYWMYVEDADLCKRAQDAGMRVAYTPSVEVIHAHGGSSRINVAVKTMTKLEVIISKHVYTWKHASGIKRWLMHSLIILLRLPGLLLAALLDLLTFRQFASLNVRTGMLVKLAKYYLGVIRTRSWLSPRAKRNQA